MTHFKAVYPISNEDTNALPVKELERAIAFYQSVLGFSVVASDGASAVLKRDEVQIGLIRKADTTRFRLVPVTSPSATSKPCDGNLRLEGPSRERLRSKNTKERTTASSS